MVFYIMLYNLLIIFYNMLSNNFYANKYILMYSLMIFILSYEVDS